MYQKYLYITSSTIRHKVFVKAFQYSIVLKCFGDSWVDFCKTISSGQDRLDRLERRSLNEVVNEVVCIAIRNRKLFC